MNRSLLLAAASVVARAFGGVSSASAQDSGLYASVSVGSTQIEQNYGGLSPEGTIVEVSLGDVFFNYDGWSIAAEAGAAYSDAQASDNGTFCIDFACNDIGKWTDEDSSKWSGTLGLVVSRPIGPVNVSVLGGVRVAQYTRANSYDYAGFSPNEAYKDTSVGFGAYYGARVEYPVNDRWSFGVEWQHSDLVRTRWSGTYGSSESSFEQETWTAGVRRKF